MSNSSKSPHTWHSHRFYAMGCQMTTWLELADENTAQSALCQVEALFHAAEARMTRFVESSELSQLNAQTDEWVPLSAVLWNVIGRALQLAEETNGLFDPTLLNAVTEAGYVHDFATMNQQDQVHTHRHYPTTEFTGRWRAVEVDMARHAIRLPHNVQLDLGSIGKGYTAQQAVNFLSHWGPCLVDAGGDLVAGDAPRDLPGWSVAIASPSAISPAVADLVVTKSAKEEDLAWIWLKNATLATSGVDYRQWQRDGRTMHHIIDPRTGEPAQTDLLTVSVLAAEATVAEAWATALFIADDYSATPTPLTNSVSARPQASKEGGAVITIADATDTTALPAKRIAAAFVDQDRKLTITPTLHPFLQMHPVIYTAVGLKTEVLGGSTRERNFRFQTELSIVQCTSEPAKTFGNDPNVRTV